MSRAQTRTIPPSRRFGWRDLRALGLGLINAGITREDRVTFQSLARISAIDLSRLPPSRTFTASDGAVLAYRTYDSESTCQLVMIHGSACFGDQLHQVARHMAEGGLATVHTLDMRGHGRSAGNVPDPDCFSADIGEFTAMLAAQGHDSIILAGHSAGGGLVLNAIGGGHARGVAGCILLAPFLGFDSRTVRPHFGGWLTRIDVAGLAFAALAALTGRGRWRDRGKPLVTFNSEAFLHDPRFARAWSFNTIFGFGPGPAAGMKPVADMPVLLLAGDRDECFRPELYESAVCRFAPDAKTVILPGLGHWDILTDKSALNACGAWMDEKIGRQTEKRVKETMENRRVKTG